MSGSGTEVGGTGLRDSGTPCERLEFETTLASPDPDVVGQLSQGSVLDIELRRAEGTAETLLVIARFRGQDVGSIVEGTPELIRCLQQGHSFQAEVLAIDDGIVRVRVKPG